MALQRVHSREVSACFPVVCFSQLVCLLYFLGAESQVETQDLWPDSA